MFSILRRKREYFWHVGAELKHAARSSKGCHFVRPLHLLAANAIARDEGDVLVQKWIQSHCEI